MALRLTKGDLMTGHRVQLTPIHFHDVTDDDLLVSMHFHSTIVIYMTHTPLSLSFIVALVTC